MIETKDIILKLKAVREEKGYSYTDILSMMEENGDYLAKSTLSRVFAEGSEEQSFRYEETIRPIAKVLGIETTIEEESVRSINSILKNKIRHIEELEERVNELNAQLDMGNAKYCEILNRENEMYGKWIIFLENQIEIKDKRMDRILDAVFN